MFILNIYTCSISDMHVTLGIVLIIFSLVIGNTECFLFRDTSRCPASLHDASSLFVHNDHCYEFKLDVEKYWDDANDDCKSRGGHLVVIKDRSTQEFLMTSLRHLGYKGDYIWIGLSDRRDEQDWRWVTGERLRGYSHWKPGQNEAGLLHKLQDCVYMQVTDSGLWYDVVCHTWPEYFSYVCQYDAIPTTTRRTTTTSTPSTTTTTTSTTTTTLPTTTVVCSEIDCAKTCPNGYQGLQVGLDGCIQCRCL